jgi:thymidylate kinase
VTSILAPKLPQTLCATFGDFDRHRIRWCLLRPVHDPGSPRGDIDILVGRGQLDEACAVAHARGFVTVPGVSHGRNLLQFDPPAAAWLWLHVVDELSFGRKYRLQTQVEDALLTRSRTVDCTRRLTPSDEFWATVLHCELDKRRIPEHHRPALQALACASAKEGPLADVVRTVCPADVTPEQVVAWAAQGDWQTLERLAAPLAAEWEARGATRPEAPWSRRLRGAIAYRARGWYRRGINVALLGPDGAGKTTLAGAIGREFVFPVRRVYMGLTGGVLQRLLRLKVPGVALVGRIMVLWARYLRARWHQARGRLVVFDRYIYDAAVPTPNPLSLGQRISRWAAGHACPRPDLVLVLSAPGDVMFARKQAYSADTLESWRQHFLALRRRFPNVVILDATKPPEAVCTDAIEQIWAGYAARWR